MKCKHTKPDASPCNADAMISSDYCFRHNPDTVEQRREASAKGGRKNGKVYKKLPIISVKSTREVAELLEKVINELRSQQIELKSANSIGYLSGNLIKALEASDMESRLLAVEKVVFKDEDQS